MHSRPTGGIRDRGDAERLAYACEAFVVVLSDDPRVREAYLGWRQDRGLEPFVTRIRERQAYQDDPSLQDLADVLALGSALESIESDKASDLCQLDAFVRRELHLTYSWLPQLLLARFGLWIVEEVRGERQLLQMRPPTRPWQRLGRKPRHGGRDIARNVCWYYRVHVKRPPDTRSQIAREYAASERRDNDARSVVQNGIKQAVALLDLVIDTSK